MPYFVSDATLHQFALKMTAATEAFKLKLASGYTAFSALTDKVALMGKDILNGPLKTAADATIFNPRLLPFLADHKIKIAVAVAALAAGTLYYVVSSYAKENTELENKLKMANTEIGHLDKTISKLTNDLRSSKHTHTQTQKQKDLEHDKQTKELQDQNNEFYKKLNSCYITIDELKNNLKASIPKSKFADALRAIDEKGKDLSASLLAVNADIKSAEEEKAKKETALKALQTPAQEEREAPVASNSEQLIAEATSGIEGLTKQLETLNSKRNLITAQYSQHVTEKRDALEKTAALFGIKLS